MLGPALGKEKRSGGSSKFGSVRLDVKKSGGKGEWGQIFFGLVWFGLLGSLLGGGDGGEVMEGGVSEMG